MYVKICGTTSVADAQLAVALGADALGFILAPSKRRVTVEETAAITRALPRQVERVGVFTEPEVSAIQEAVQQGGLSAVQMHWRYDPGITAALRRVLGPEVRLWQVVGFETDPEDAERAEAEFTAQLRASLLDAAVEAVLLDSVKRGTSGGLGQAFSWTRAAALVGREQAAARQRTTETRQPLPKLMLAGGLTPENVAAAIVVMRPDGVDVVSGVEKSPGHKDPDKVKQFLERAECFRSGRLGAAVV